MLRRVRDRYTWRMNTPLAQIFRHSKWANERIIDACRALPDDKLDTRVFSGPGRSIRETLFHLVAGQCDFLARLNGQSQDPARPREWTGFAALTDLAEATGEALITAAESMIEDHDVVVPYAGKQPMFPRSFFLTHAFAHGAQHPTEIVLMLEQLGLPAPNLDGWEYAAAAGFGADT
jgi:uncharacterized damage-inducible protein DinB